MAGSIAVGSLSVATGTVLEGADPERNGRIQGLVHRPVVADRPSGKNRRRTLPKSAKKIRALVFSGKTVIPPSQTTARG
jgi:hypothetical protein